MLKKLFTCRKNGLNILFPKRAAHLDSKIDLKELEAEMQPVGIAAIKAKNRFDTAVVATKNSRLSDVELSEDTKKELEEKAKQLQKELEERGLELDVDLRKKLQNHLNRLKLAIETGKINKELLENLKETEASINEVWEIETRKRGTRIRGRAITAGNLIAAPGITAVAVFVSLFRGIRDCFK